MPTSAENLVFVRLKNSVDRSVSFTASMSSLPTAVGQSRLAIWSFEILEFNVQAETLEKCCSSCLMPPSSAQFLGNLRSKAIVDDRSFYPKGQKQKERDNGNLLCLPPHDQSIIGNSMKKVVPLP